ncbi:MAG TPA: AAA family ATPase [Planctomycetota bacterium]|jgi:predicted ATPase|nr:AAA family ATPase [Planctomycetota bacterium]
MSENTKDLRVYLVGAHATGKTTLARYIRDHYGLPMISEVARAVLAELETNLDRLRSDVDAVSRYQREVFFRQIEAERAQASKGGFVSDRAFCNLSYAANHATIMAEVFRDPILDDYMRWVGEGIVFFLRPHREFLQADGVRAGLAWEDVLVVDGMVKLFLEMYGVPYFPVSMIAMQERVRLVDAVLSLKIGRRCGSYRIAPSAPPPKTAASLATVVSQPKRARRTGELPLAPVRNGDRYPVVVASP